MSTEVDLAWLAGLFEGEGCIRINKPTARNMGALAVTVTNTDVDVLHPFMDRWPGYFKSVSVREGRSEAWMWAISARVAAGALAEMLPYVRSERVRARIRLALEFQGQKRAGRPRADPDADRTYADRQIAYYWRMRSLNAGRRHPDVVAAMAAMGDG